MNTPEHNLADTHDTQPRIRRTSLARQILKPLASLQLTIVLFALGIGLVFFGTLAQTELGIWTVVDKYFWSEIVWVDMKPVIRFFQIFFNVPPSALEVETDGKMMPTWLAQQSFPFIGGRLLGFLMFINLLAAHALRFKLTWKRSGIFILHLGILALFIGEFITREFQVEQQMTIDQGSYSDFTVDTKNYELAFVSEKDASSDNVVVVPWAKLLRAERDGQLIEHPSLPVNIKVHKTFKNSRLAELASLPSNPATAGIGTQYGVRDAAEVSGVDQTKEVDAPSMYVELFDRSSNNSLGVYLMSLWIEDQDIVVNNTKYSTSLRRTHYYKPYKIYLNKFTFERYLGTETPKNFKSDIRLEDPEYGSQTETSISMNDPLRHRGETFYQADFDKRTEKTTILQVVRNPGWLLPYISCALVSLGMLVHFMISLMNFILNAKGKRLKSEKPLDTLNALVNEPIANPEAAQARTALERWLPIAFVGFLGLYLASTLYPKQLGDFDTRAAASIPVIDRGRVKPLDTVARVNLRALSTGEEFRDANLVTQPALRWYLDTAAAPDYSTAPAKDNKVFKIVNDEVLKLLDLTKAQSDNWRFSHSQLWERREKYAKTILEVLKKKERIDKKLSNEQLSLFETRLLEVWKQLGKYEDVWVGRDVLLFPPAQEGDDWRNPFLISQAADQAVLNQMNSLGGRFKSLREIEEAIEQEADANRRRELRSSLETMRAEAQSRDDCSLAWQKILVSLRTKKQDDFNTAVQEFKTLQAKALTPGQIRQVNFEAWLNGTGLYFKAIGFYVLAFLVSMAGYMALAFGNSNLANALRRASLGVLLLTFLAHTFVLFSRMYLMERPLVFVTNLYSSAVFIGWAAVGICMIIERIFPIGIGNTVGAVIGFSTAIVAHNILDGDSLEMMQAVLDTNFWLATHVTTVTLGYAATYIAGLFGTIYVILGVFTPWIKSKITVLSGGQPKELELGRVIGQVMYGVVCLATLLSFVGTVLGGIWADQSWGRFWGWDPKENGAVLIVLWNALILHARWCGLIKDRGMAVLALVGNMITTWSWFGTNQLGVGLHAYGFSKELAMGCMITWVAHLGLVVVGMIPQRFWVSSIKTSQA